MASDTLTVPKTTPKCVLETAQQMSPKSYPQSSLKLSPNSVRKSAPKSALKIGLQIRPKSSPKSGPNNSPQIGFQMRPLAPKCFLVIMVIKKPYLHPPLVMIRAASKTSRQAPKAQKQSIKTTHLARCWVGKNSANNVTDWGTQPILNPTRNLRNKIQP